MALSIFVPIGYITVLVVSLSIFSKVYRKRTAQALVRDHHSPWFSEGHPERDLYQTLVQAASANPSTTTAEKDKQNVVPDVVLKAALLNRAMADVKRIIRMRDDKQALQTLLQKGSIGDETMAKFTLAEKELEAEILDVVSEANTFREGWGQLIFPTASEMVAHLKHKEIYYGIQQQRAEEVKKLIAAGKPVPQPSVTLPALVTPPGTQITIQTPSMPVQGPQPPPPAAAAPAVNGQATKSGTVQDANDEVRTPTGSIKSKKKENLSPLEKIIGPTFLQEYTSLANKSPNTLQNLLDVDNEDAWDDEDDSSESDERSDCVSDDDDCCSSQKKSVTLYFKDPTPQSTPSSQPPQKDIAEQQQQKRGLSDPAEESKDERTLESTNKKRKKKKHGKEKQEK